LRCLLSVCRLARTPHAATHPPSLHDALPISPPDPPDEKSRARSSASSVISPTVRAAPRSSAPKNGVYGVVQMRSSPEVMSTETRSEEHTSELQSRGHLVCRLLLEKKKSTRTR